MPKKFIYFLVVIQAVVSLGHWLLYESLLFFFPDLAAFRHPLFVLLMILSISFITLSVLTFKKENPILKVAYIISSIWIPIWFYSLLASCLSLLTYLILRPFDTLILRSIIFGLAVVFSAYGIINARIRRVVQISIKLPNLPEYWKGKTAVLASDLHLGHILKKGFAQNVINSINRLQPDIVFIPGDFFDGVQTNFSELANLFKQVRARHGIYFASGNHEEIAGMQTCEDAIRNAGIHILDNQKVELEGLQVAGIAYEHEQMPNLPELLKNLNIDSTKPSILLKHVPLQLKETENSGISLMLSGHTHQGQLWPGNHITKRYYSGMDYGHHFFDKLQLYISSGVGTWGPPMRTFTKSEIVRITFI